MTPEQSALHAAGPLAERTAHLWWLAFWLASGVYVVVLGMLWWAMARARRREREGAVLDEGGEQRMTKGVTYGIAAAIVILLTFLVADLSVGRTLSPIPITQPLTIELTGKQWWWQATYADTSVHGRFTTANEIHVPVGTPVLFLLSAQDVIHSLWVPSLAGKKDMIPGYTQSFWFTADTAGIYRGQCAEFCGMQHAKMALFIVAEPHEQYRAWVARQQQPSSIPTDSAPMRGKSLLLGGTCVMCHAIEGTPAGSHAGPDLTHLASRRTIAAGSLPNTRETLRAWITDPQRIKPGAKMPATAFAPNDMNALLSYLESLK